MCPTKITRNVVNDEHDYYVMLTDMDDQTKFSANWIDYSAPVDTSDIYVKVQWTQSGGKVTKSSNHD